MKKMKFAFLAVILLTAVSAFSVSQSQLQLVIIGKWKYQVNAQISAIIEFRRNGTATQFIQVASFKQVVHGTYKVKNNVLTTTFAGKTESHAVDSATPQRIVIKSKYVYTRVQ